MHQSGKVLNRVSQEIDMNKEAKLFVHCWIAYHLKQMILFNLTGILFYLTGIC